jgi:hypothetical protein
MFQNLGIEAITAGGGGSGPKGITGGGGGYLYKIGGSGGGFGRRWLLTRICRGALRARFKTMSLRGTDGKLLKLINVHKWAVLRTVLRRLVRHCGGREYSDSSKFRLSYRHGAGKRVNTRCNHRRGHVVCDCTCDGLSCTAPVQWILRRMLRYPLVYAQLYTCQHDQ